MSVADTLAILQTQFASSTGFLARLQRGEGIDSTGVQQVWQAVDALRVTWSEQECIPVAALLVLMQVDNTIFSCIDQYPDADLQRAIADLGMQMQERVQAAIAPAPLYWVPEPPRMRATAALDSWERWCQERALPELPRTESRALAIIREHLAGPGFLVALGTHHLAARDPGVLRKRSP